MNKPIEQVDVLIVGSGPAGTSTALHLLQNDPAWGDRVVMVDKATHPREKLCGGGVTHLGTNVLTHLGLSFEPDHFEVRETRLVYGDQYYSFFGNPVFRITRRDKFDHWLVQKVAERGIRVRQGEAVKDIVPGADFVTVTTTKAVFQAKVVVAADGSKSFVRTRLKWDDDSRVARLLEVLTPEDSRRQPEFRDGVAVFDFTPMSEGLQGYYWDFPSFVEGEPFMNRGVFDSRARPEREKANLKETLDEAMAERERDLENYQLKGHPIRWFDPRGKFSMPRIILVGDAAGVDPLFGEGISFALSYGGVAAVAITEAFARQDFSFADYGQLIMAHGDFKHLAWRTRLARLAYRRRSPWVVKFGWYLARMIVRLTPWRNREYNPHQSPERGHRPAGEATLQA